MKKGEQAQFSAKWWKDSQPHGMTKARPLEVALHAYEEAKHALETHPSPQAARKADAALDAIEAALKAVIAEAARSRTPESVATADVLKHLDLDKERAWVTAHAKPADDDDDDSPFSEAGYDAYLRKSQKRLRGGPMNFAAVLLRKPADHRLALHRVQPPMTLGHLLMRETGSHLMTYGTACADPAKPRAIQLTIEGRQLPGMKKKLTRMLRAFRPLPFVVITLHTGGSEIEDVVDPDDLDDDDDDALNDDDTTADLDEPALREEMNHILPELHAAMEGSAEKRHVISEAVQRFVARTKAGDLSGARAALISLYAQIPGVHTALRRQVAPDEKD